MEHNKAALPLDALLIIELGLPNRSPWPSAQECRDALLTIAKRGGFEAPASGDEEETGIALRDWVYEADRDTMFFVRKPGLAALLYPELSSKVVMLGQRFCPICPAYGPSGSYPIRLPPRSWQCSSSEIKAAFKAAIGDWWGFKGKTPLEGPICVAITFVIPTSKRRADLDNMAKGLLDSFEGLLYRNDSQIDHLDLLRIASSGAESFISARVQQTGLNNHDDVLDPRMRLGFTDDAIDLADYFPA